MAHKKINSAAVFSRQGLGDGLMMMIASYHLKLAGYNVTFYHRLFHELKTFFSGYIFKDIPKDISEIKSFDLIIIEHYANDLLNEIIKERDDFSGKVYVFYPSFKRKYFFLLHSSDFLFDKKKSMNTNIQWALSKILNSNSITKINGVNIPKNLIHRKYKERVVLHPTSSDIKKNWEKQKFIKLFNLLKSIGLSPIFSLAPHEVHEWEKEKVSFITFKNFDGLASYIYESGYFIGNDSGPAHLSSNLNIPSIVIASNPNQMKLWRPDFNKTKVITAPSFIPNIKNFRLRDRYWSCFISVKKVFKEFKIIYYELLQRDAVPLNPIQRSNAPLESFYN